MIKQLNSLDLEIKLLKYLLLSLSNKNTDKQQEELLDLIDVDKYEEGLTENYEYNSYSAQNQASPHNNTFGDCNLRHEFILHYVEEMAKDYE